MFIQNFMETVAALLKLKTLFCFLPLSGDQSSCDSEYDTSMDWINEE